MKEKGMLRGLAWYKDKVQVQMHRKGFQFIHMCLKFNKHDWWWFTPIYASHIENVRNKLWNKISAFNANIPNQRLIAGDYNDIVSQVKKRVELQLWKRNARCLEIILTIIILWIWVCWVSFYMERYDLQWVSSHFFRGWIGCSVIFKGEATFLKLMLKSCPKLVFQTITPFWWFSMMGKWFIILDLFIQNVFG